MEEVLDKKIVMDKSNWLPVKFGDVVFEPKESTKDPIGDNIEHVVGLEHIISEDIHLRNSNGIEESTTFTKKFAVDDVLFGRRRAYLKKAAQAKFSGICSGDITVFRAKDNLLPELLPFIVQNDKFFDYAVKHSAGGLSPRVKFKDLANYEFLLPSKDQQAKLAELLWAMDEVIESDIAILEKLKIAYQVEIEESVPRDFKEYWTLGDVIQTRKGVTYKSSDYSDEENGIPLLNLKSIERGGGFNTGGMKYYKGAFKEDHFAKNEDLIIACTDITREGRVVGYPLHPSVYQNTRMLFTMDLIAIQISDKNLLRDYLYYVLKAGWVHWFLFAYSPGTTVLHLDLKGMKKLKIPKYDISVQKEIVNKLKQFENSIFELESKISSSKALQKSLINQVF
ncbi:type I restriction enzyme S subunit [Winogradskyella wandonensis]|uniref:Type I restriction enzyme S subunit n=1 Tax=Winogradskyella wandonensis TaxID=1442586 RepID=A0A4R1KRN5_9FLAO|nr:restriction endonuclease subunit S [Winogradskyella wandonensis]TCK67247.1 type I restriction enzyme S subunit [Winogradskyella wandonensis]